LFLTENTSLSFGFALYTTYSFSPINVFLNEKPDDLN
jgi:hypothetical protein